MTSKFSRVIVILAAVVLFAAGANAEIQQVGIMANGPVFAITESNGYIYAGQGGEVHVYDVTTREKALALNWSDRLTKFHEPASLGQRITSLIARDNILYATDSRQLFITDISNPASPALLSYLNMPAMYMVLSENGDFAYVFSTSTLTTVDISNPANPVIVSSVAGGGAPWRAVISGDKLFVGHQAAVGEILTFDLTDPGHPVRISDYHAKTGTGISGLAIKGNYLYAVDYYASLKIIDITDPSNPQPVYNISGITGASDAQVDGNYLYVSTRYEGFRVYDLTNPALPIKISSGVSETPGYTEGIFVDQDTVYLAVESIGFEIYDVTDKTKPKRLMHVFTLGGADSIEMDGNHMYIGGHNDGIWVLDAADKNNIQEIGFGYNAGRNAALERDGNYLYYAGAWAGIGMFDVSNPANPQLVYEKLGPNTGNVVLSPDKNFIYTSSGIFDVTNRTTWPFYTNKTVNWGFVYATYGDNYVVTHNGNLGWQIYDVTDKTMPVLMSSFEPNRATGGGAYGGIGIWRNYVIGTAVNDVMLYDITDVRNPVLKQRLRYGGGSWAPTTVVVVGDAAYVSGSGTTIMRVFDLGTYTNLSVVDTAQNKVHYWDGQYLYQINKFGIGVYLPSDKVITPTPTPTATPVPTTTEPTPDPTTVPTTEIPTITTLPTTIPTTEPTPEPTDPPACVCPTPTPQPVQNVCIEISTTGMRLITCPA